MIRIAFDIGGVISKYPNELSALIAALGFGTAVEVHVITDMHPRELVLETLAINGFGHIQPDRVHVADYTSHGEGCKAELLASLGIDIFFDDFLGYVAAGGAPIRCLVMPDATRPYYHETWKTPGGEADFGRRAYRKAVRP